MISVDEHFGSRYVTKYEDFEYDGEGVDVHVVIADNEDFVDYTNLTEDLRPEGPYEGVTLTVPLREGMVLDGTTHVSIWCIPFAADFGSGTFVAPEGG